MSKPAIAQSVLDLIGNTPMVRLSRYFSGAKCEVLGKCDFMNPAGSVKDRIGFAMIDAAEREGKLRPGGTIVEATAGNTGLGLCLAAAIKGYSVVCCTPDKMSQEKINLMRAFGARVIVVPTVPKNDPNSYINTAKRVAAETPNGYYIGQFQNPANELAHYQSTGKEIWEQTDGKVSVFVASAGTTGTIGGVSRFLKEKNPRIRVVLGDPQGSLYAHWCRHKNLDAPSAPYKVEGIGNDYLPSIAYFSRIDAAFTIPDRESFNAARRLARVEGLFCGGSTGTNLVAATRYIRENDLSERDVVVVFLCDTGERYLSKVFNDAWMRENQFLGDVRATTASELIFEKHANGRPLVVANPETPVAEVFGKLKQLDISQVPVISKGQIVGAVTESKILDLLLAGADISRMTVADVMGDPLRVVDPSATAKDMLAVMQNAQQDGVIVRDGDEFEILTKFDLLRAL